MVVVIDNVTVKQFGVDTGTAYEYAEVMMRKGHDVFVMSKREARWVEFL